MNIFCETDNKIKASEALRKAALNNQAKSYLLGNPTLFNLLLKAARRYIGGETLQEALETRAAVIKQGFKTSLEFMGEDVACIKEANEATDEFLRIIKALKIDNKEERVSLDLSHLGLFLNYENGIKNFWSLAKAVENSQIDIFISAEGMDKTDQILNTYEEFSQEFPHVGITLQAYLHRSPKDLERILKYSRGKIRLVKGAYEGPKSEFLGRGPKLDARYIEMAKNIFSAQRFCSIATHDANILDQIQIILEQEQIISSRYEFEMLYGIGDNEIDRLKKRGHSCRRYIVYGKEWYLYLCNRIAEHPENLFRALVDIVN